MIHQPFAKCVLGRFLGELKPPPITLINYSEVVTILSSYNLMLFEDIIALITCASPVSYAYIIPIDATNVVLTATTFSRLYTTLANSTSSITATMTLVDRVTYIQNIINYLYISGYSIGIKPNTTGVNVNSETWVLNMENSASSQYDNFGFNSFSFDPINQRYLACSEEGIYQLTGTTDAGTAIDSLVEFGTSNFGTQQLKNISNAWLGLSTSGKVYLKVEADNNIVTYEAKDYNPILQNQRIDIGKGLRGSYWKFSVIAHTPMELESITFLPIPINRRIK